MKKLVTTWMKNKLIKKVVVIIIVGLLSAVGLSSELTESLRGPISDLVDIIIGG